MLSTEMLFRELEDRQDAYKQHIRELEKRAEELATDRATLLKCWFSAAEKLRELGYYPRMDKLGRVEEWCFEHT